MLLWAPSLVVCLWTLAFLSHTSGPAVLRARSAIAQQSPFSPLPKKGKGLLPPVLGCFPAL